MSEKNSIIKKYRLERGYTQKQLGEKCGINEANIRKYETGRQNAKYETLEKIADALEIPVTTLLPEKQTKKIVIDTSKMVKTINKTYDIKNEAEKSFYEMCKDILEKEYSDLETLYPNESCEENEKVFKKKINVSEIKNLPINRALLKIQNEETLEPEEQQALDDFIQSGGFQRAFKGLSESTRKLANLLRQNYELLNEEGRKKADKHIRYAVDQIELLTKIPEYRKD